MDGIDWKEISEEEHEAWKRRLTLVETLLDECIEERERRQTRWAYQREHGVSERIESRAGLPSKLTVQNKYA